MKALINVDCSKVLGSYRKPHVNNNWCDRHHFHESYYSDLEFMKQQGIDFDIFRMWTNPRGWFDFERDEYRFEVYYRYFEGASRVSHSILINTGSPVKNISMEKYREILKGGLKHYKEIFPKIKYIECLNEVDLEKTLNESEYYEYYKLYYSVINEINAELRPQVPLEVGGIAVYRFDTNWLRAFLDMYKKDSDINKKLDFISYHQYGRQDEVCIREDNIAAVARERDVIEDMLRERDLPVDIPSFITEMGVFPGGNGTQDVGADLLTQAAGMAEMNYYYLSSSRLNVPFQWSVRHKANERKDMLVKDCTEKLTPFGNVLKMYSMMKSKLIAADSDAAAEGGIGVEAMATMDDSGIAIMLWNYQWTRPQAPDYETTVNISSLPDIFEGKSIRLRRYLIDEKHSNYAWDLNTANLQKVEDTLIYHEGSWASTINMGKNAVCLIALSPEFSEYSENQEFCWAMKEDGAIADTKGLNDNNPETYLKLEGNGVHVQYDLGSVRTVNSVDLAFHEGDRRITSFEIKTFNEDGSGWTKVLAASSSGKTKELESFSFEAVRTRYIKIVGYGSNVDNVFAISEIKINEVK